MHSGKCSFERNSYQISELCRALKLDLQGFKFNSTGLWNIHDQGWPGLPTAKSPFLCLSKVSRCRRGQLRPTAGPQCCKRSDEVIIKIIHGATGPVLNSLHLQAARRRSAGCLRISRQTLTSVARKCTFLLPLPPPPPPPPTSTIIQVPLI